MVKLMDRGAQLFQSRPLIMGAGLKLGRVLLDQADRRGFSVAVRHPTTSRISFEGVGGARRRLDSRLQIIEAGLDSQ